MTWEEERNAIFKIIKPLFKDDLPDSIKDLMAIVFIDGMDEQRGDSSMKPLQEYLTTLGANWPYGL